MNAIESQCRAWNMDVSDLTRALGRGVQEITLAAMSNRCEEVRREIAHYFRFSCWLDLVAAHAAREITTHQSKCLHEKNYSSRDVPEKPVTVLARGKGTLLFEHEGVFYVDTRKNGKLLKRRQVFNRREADIIYAEESREGA